MILIIHDMKTIKISILISAYYLIKEISYDTGEILQINLF